MVIVEVPAPDAAHEADPEVRQQVADVRSWLYTRLHLTHEPSSSGTSIGGRAYIDFSGALFFEGPTPRFATPGFTAWGATCGRCIR